MVRIVQRWREREKDRQIYLEKEGDFDWDFLSMSICAVVYAHNKSLQGQFLFNI